MTIYNYSNPHEVYNKAIRLLDNTSLHISTRKNKKYMIMDPSNDKWIHFGQMGYQDYTKHKNLMRREAFRLRNMEWKNAPHYSPRWLAYHLLW